MIKYWAINIYYNHINLVGNFLTTVQEFEDDPELREVFTKYAYQLQKKIEDRLVDAMVKDKLLLEARVTELVEQSKKEGKKPTVTTITYKG